MDAKAQLTVDIIAKGIECWAFDSWFIRILVKPPPAKLVINRNAQYRS